MRGERQTIVESELNGAILGAVALAGGVLFAIAVTGYIDAFSRDRGFLQLVLAIPVASLVIAAGASAFGLLGPSQLLWAMAPVEVLIFAGTGLFGGDFVAWYWAAVANVVLFVPWLAGVGAGTMIRRRSAR